jgi:hypothetical protein
MKSKTFSERHDKAIRDKRIKLTLRQELRRSFLRLLVRYSTIGGWNNEENFTFDAVISEMLDRRGWPHMLWWDGKKMQPADNFGDFIEKGIPSYVLDAIELFLEVIDSKKRPGFVQELNTLFEIHHSPLRYFRGEFYLIDSAFLESQVLVQAQQLLEASEFQGALDEFLRARAAYTEKEFKQAILMANHAFESTLKGVLGVDKKKTGELVKKVCFGGLVPSYYEGFLDSLHDLLSIVPMTRDNESGHGQGKDLTTVAPALAELAIHLSGSMIVFLIKRHMEKESAPPDDDDIPF